MPKKILVILNKIISWSVVALVFLIPLFFLPLTADFYDFNKNTLLVVGCCLLLLAWAGKMLLTKEVSFRRTILDLPVLAIMVAFGLSTAFAQRYRVAMLTTPGATGTVIALTAYYFLITNNIKKPTYINYSLILSASLVALIVLAEFFGLGQRLAPVDWLKLKTWTPAGSLLATAAFLIVVFFLLLGEIIAHYRGQKTKPLLATSFFLILLAAGLGTVAYQLLTEAKPILLPYWAGWQIAIETIKRLPFLGFGPGNFLNAFTLTRPIGLNLTDFWGLRFGTSSNWFLELIATAGLVGLASWLWLVWKILRVTVEPGASRVLPFGLLASLLLFLLLPNNFLLLFVFYVLLAIFASNLTTRDYQEESKVLPVVIFIVALAMTLPALYFSGRFWLADFYFRQSLTALAQNKGKETYDLQIKTISFNPYHETYHLAYSQTNLALANSLAGQPNLSDQDKNNISQLIQQAIREAKISISLNQNNAQNWENLALIYRNLINFAQGAEQWAFTGYQQAILLDPTNPTLRLNLGGIFYSLGQYDEAIRFFQQAIDLKPNFANGHYNLASAYREKKEYAPAAGQMEITLSLIEVNSADWQKAQKELEDLRAKLPATPTPSVTPTPGAEEKLSPPEPLPSPIITPPLELPAESSPPAANSNFTP